MEKETLKNIFKFLEDEGEHKAPFKWKLENNIPLSKEDLKVEGNLNLIGSDIKSLPEGLEVGGDLGLYKTNITSLPKGLEVGGYLNLNDTKIKSLPKGLKVGGYLYIYSTPLTKYFDNELREMVKPGFIKGKIRR